MSSRRREKNLLAPMGANTGEMGTEVRPKEERKGFPCAGPVTCTASKPLNTGFQASEVMQTITDESVAG